MTPVREFVLPVLGEPLTEEEANWLVGAADKNKDGSLDFQELLKVMIGK